MCHKSLSVQGEHGDFRVVSMYEVVSEYFHTFTLLAGAIVDCVFSNRFFYALHFPLHFPVVYGQV